MKGERGVGGCGDRWTRYHRYVLSPAIVSRSRTWFLLPIVLWVVCLTIFPLLFSLGLSFFHYRLGDDASFAGFANYGRLFGDYRFWNALKITVGLAVAATTIEMVLGLALAVLLFETHATSERWRMAMTIPLFMAPVALGYLGLTVFHEESGPVNLLLRSLNHPGIPWLSSAGWAFISVMLVDVWEWTPFCFLVTYAALLAQPPDLLEAARLEPLSPWGKFRHLTLPMLRPTLALVALLRFVEALKTVDLPFSLTGGGPAIATETLGLYTYFNCMKFFDFGYGSALAYVMFALVLVASQLLARWNLRRASA